MKKTTVILLISALLSTYIAVPLYGYAPAIYGSPSITNLGFVKDYIFAWWRKTVRRYILGQTGLAENATVNPEEAEKYQLPSTKVNEPTNIYELLNKIKQEKYEYSTQILNFLEQNNIPNKSAQLDLMVVPESIYVTFVWDGCNLELYDGWIGDQYCKEYVVAIATSDLIMNLYQNRNDIETCKNLILNAEADGSFTYTVKRANPTIAEWILYLQAIATMCSIIGWGLFFSEKLRKVR